jgi:aspartyl-tRNA(Asn)/glutamyl-tRNA(Gln) amidotransferase subunit A
MKSFAFASISELQQALEKKEISKADLLDYFFKRFEKYNPKINAAIEVFGNASVLKDSKEKGILAGIPGLIKDNICQKDRIAACASKMLENFTSIYDATAVKRLKDVGAFCVGRANCDEFAMGSSTETSAFGKTFNPWDVTRVPGGSSGGSIAAVAAGLVPWSLGSETGGSVRQPAALCGIVGIKPTYGLISRYGLVAYASSLDQIGIATRTVKDTALVLSAIAGQDSNDSSTLPVMPKDYTQGLDGKLKPGLKIGVIDNAMNAEGMDPEVRASIEEAIKVLEKSGAIIKRVSLPVMDYAASIYFIISRAEAASNLARFDGVRYGYRDKEAKTLNEMYEDSRQKGFGKEVKARIMTGNYVLSAGHASSFYSNALKAQRWMRAEFTRIFQEVDLLVSPTSPTTAFKLGAFDDNKLQMDLQDYFTCSANIAGIPAISIPCGFSKENLPIGFQLIGPHLSESLILQTAYAYEQQTPWHTMHPKGFE